MFYTKKGILVPLLFCALAVTCLFAISGSAGAVELPPNGDYDVGYIYEHNVSAWSYELEVKYYYPATSEGEGATPDTSGAPYPTIKYNQNFRGRWPGIEDESAQISYLVSHGMVVVVEISDARDQDISPIFIDLLDHLEMLNADDTSPLFGLMDKDAYGMVGYDLGAALSWVQTGHMFKRGDMRIKLVHGLTPEIPIGESDIDECIDNWVLGEASLTFQRGTKEPIGLMQAYRGSRAPKCLITWSSSDRGYDLMMADILYKLGGQEEYRTLVYGSEALSEMVEGNRSLEYKASETDFFPPEIDFMRPDDSYMDESVPLEIKVKGTLILDHPEIDHGWDIDGDSDPDKIGVDGPNVTYEFTVPGDYGIKYVYRLGAFDHSSPRKSMMISNVLPTADAGPDDNDVPHDSEEYLVDGSSTIDSASDLPNLEYKWSFTGGTETEFSTDATYCVDCKGIGTLEGTLTVRDPWGAESVDTVVLTIKNVVPEVEIDPFDNPTEDLELSLTGQGTDTVTHLSGLVYKWVFAPGDETEWNSDPAITRTYTDSGEYPIKLWVKDAHGDEAFDEATVTVSNVAPDCGILTPKDIAKPTVDKKVTFACWGNDTTSDEAGLLYMWEFGDGKQTEWLTLADAGVTHSYKKTGPKTVTLNVKDDDGETFQTTVTLKLQPRDVPGFGAFSAILLVGVAASLVLWRRRWTE
jgi:hypothetical protein